MSWWCHSLLNHCVDCDVIHCQERSFPSPCNDFSKRKSTFCVLGYFFLYAYFILILTSQICRAGLWPCHLHIICGILCMFFAKGKKISTSQIIWLLNLYYIVSDSLQYMTHDIWPCQFFFSGNFGSWSRRPTPNITYLVASAMLLSFVTMRKSLAYIQFDRIWLYKPSTVLVLPGATRHFHMGWWCSW